MALSKQEFCKRENERKRRWRAQKKAERARQDKAVPPEPAPSHFTGKKPLQFKDENRVNTTKARKHLRLRWRSRKKYQELVPEAKEPDQPDVVEEQVEKPQTTKHCPESIKEDGLKEVRRNPEYYIEINMVTKSRVVDTFYIPSEKKKFHYKTKEYQVDEETIYLLPTKLGLFMPTCHYKEGSYKPQGFKQTNKGITGKALSLLYMEQLYTSLLYNEDVKYNFFIVILSIVSLVAYGIGLYFLFFHSGGLLAPAGDGGGSTAPVSLIMPWRHFL